MRDDISDDFERPLKAMYTVSLSLSQKYSILVPIYEVNDSANISLREKLFFDRND